MITAAYCWVYVSVTSELAATRLGSALVPLLIWDWLCMIVDGCAIVFVT